MALLEIAGASKYFGATAAVDNVSFDVEPGELFALLGPSGCGKTTLLRLIAGFETPDSGRIVIDGTDITALPPYERPVNMMFQSYALFPHLDVAANIAFGLRQEGMERRRRDARVAEMLALVQMSDYARRRPHELSGGQRQRVALARALAKMPKLLLLDEPLAALDRKLREETRRELIGIQERVGTAFLIVTHDQEEALGMAAHVAVMNAGRIAQIGTPAEIYERPNSRFVADFVGEVNLFEGEVVESGGDSVLCIAGIDRPVPLPTGADQPGGAATALVVRPEKLSLSHERPARFALEATSRRDRLSGAGVDAAPRDTGRAAVEGASAERRGRWFCPRLRGLGELGIGGRGRDRAMIGIGRLGRLALIGLPFLWLGLFFLLPLLIVVKISLAHSAIGIPPYTPLVTGGDGNVSLHATLANFMLLARDDLYLRAYLNSLTNAALATALCLVVGYPIALAIATHPPPGASCCCFWSYCRSGPAF